MDSGVSISIYFISRIGKQENKFSIFTRSNLIYFLGDSATCKTIDGRNPYGKKTTDYVKIRTTEVQKISAILVK